MLAKHSGVGVGCFASRAAAAFARTLLCGVGRVASFLLSVRSWLTVANQASSSGGNLAACACASFTASSRAITRPCSIIRAAVWALTSERIQRCRDLPIFASCHSRHYRRYQNAQPSANKHQLQPSIFSEEQITDSYQHRFCFLKALPLITDAGSAHSVVDDLHNACRGSPEYFRRPLVTKNHAADPGGMTFQLKLSGFATRYQFQGNAASV